MYDPSECPCCGGVKPAVWDLCNECLGRYGYRDEWPEWLRFLVNDHARQRREHGRLVMHEFEVAEIDEEYAMPEDLCTRPLSEMVWSACSARMLIPADPYSDDLTNQQYRRANGVIEEDLSDGL